MLRRFSLPALLIVFLVAPLVQAAEPTMQERLLISQMSKAVRRAGGLLENGKTKEAADLVTKVQEYMAKMVAGGADPALVKLLNPVVDQLKEVHALLELDGVKVPALPDIKEKTPGKPGEPGISFAKDVAAILASKCGRCHVDDAKGKISMTTYAALMQGSPTDGVIIMPGNSRGSRIMEVIASGDMPRGGGKLTAEQFETLGKWIDQGARFDGPQPDVPLRQLASAAAPDDAQKLEVVKATGKESVRFALEIAPVLVEQCNGCHGTERPRARFSVATFARLLAGGESGPVIAPGKPAESLLVKKIQGSAGERMPLERPPLSAEIIAKIEAWIAEGAKFDGPSAEDSLARVAAVVRAQNSTPEELSRDRIDLAAKNWRLAVPDDISRQATTENFLLVGNVSQGQLEEIGELAESQYQKVSATIRTADSKPPVKGRLTIFVFANRFDYSEFGYMVEKRRPPKNWSGHWNYDIIDPYILIVPPRTSEPDSLEGLLAQHLAGTYVAARGGAEDLPRWIVEGTGRAVAAKINPKDPRVQEWDNRLPEILARMSKPDDFLTGNLPPEDADVVSYSFVDFLMSNAAGYRGLLDSLDQGIPLDAALAKAYRAPLNQITQAWAVRGAGKRR